MNPAIVGFTAWRHASPKALRAARAAQARVVARFERLATRSVTVGSTTIDIWGAGELETCLHCAPDGSLLALVGAPQPPVSWADLPDAFLAGDDAALDGLPWEGRIVLVRISADGERWTLCNDWMGAIPVFHATGAPGLVASTLEPAVVAAMGYTPGDIRPAALLSILINGHLLSDWGFYRGLRTVPPDSVATWDGAFHTRVLCSVVPTTDRWETRWSDLVEEMHALQKRAVTDALAAAPAWMLPLSGGLDSRLIACIGRDIGADVVACAWGASDTVDVVCSRAVARTLRIPWTHVDLGTDYLDTFTRPWTEWFGSAMHVHGMYQMAFYDAAATSDTRPVVSGFVNDVLSGAGGRETVPARGQLYDEWYGHWTIDELRHLLRVPVDAALEELAHEIETQLSARGGAPFQQDTALEIWNRCPLFAGFQVTLADYWRGVSAPFVNRAYARFCFSLPLVAVDERRLMRDVFRRYYPSVAAVPGTYGPEPLLRTGSYLVMSRLARMLPRAWRRGPLEIFAGVHPRMDCDALRASGRAALWPIPQTERALASWLDVDQLAPLYDRAVSDLKDYRALRRLQSVQTLAYRLLDA